MSTSVKQEEAKESGAKQGAAAYDSPSTLTKHASYRGETAPLPMYDTLEMGVHNSGFVADANSNRASTIMQMRGFSPYAVDTPTAESGNSQTPSDPNESPYLKAVDGSAGHQYEDLAHMAAKLAANKPKAGGPRKKTNVLYEPAEINNGKPSVVFARPSEPSKVRPVSSGTSRIFLFMLMVVAFISLIALVIAILATQGILNNDKECSCSTGTAMKSSGVDTRVDYLMKKVKELEANYTTLKQRLDPQANRIDVLKSLSDQQTSVIAGMNFRLVAEERATVQVNRSVLSIEQQMVTVASNLNGKIIMVGESLNATIKQTTAELQMKDNQLMTASQQINQSLTQQIMNISLTPGPQGPSGPQGLIGPQGPQGAGNLTQCKTKDLTQKASPPSDKARATVSSRISATPGFVIVGGSCSSKNALRTFLEWRSNDLYQCSCNELSASLSEDIECTVRIWECPKGPS